MLHFLVLHFFRVVCCPCCALFGLVSFWIALFPPVLYLFCLALFFCVWLFLCCTFFVLHSFHIAPFFFCISSHVALVPCCIFFVLHFFQFRPSFLTCILFCSFHCALSFTAFPHTEHFSHCTFSCCTHFMLHLFLHPISHVVLFLHHAFPERVNGCGTLFTSHFPRAWKWLS